MKINLVPLASTLLFLGLTGCGQLESIIGKYSTIASGSSSGSEEKGHSTDGPEEDQGKSSNGKVCHVPPGNPDGKLTLHVAANALKAHLDHGDKLGPCEHGKDKGEEEAGS
ncbi:MAG: hypothetical protein HYR96_09235 [Deltaproteobacteria bacterium]|nr:hypothetical protein [Deltaproteobacteria bacterium]MBI3294609.1 hypothetical protein [Deltaproteobacteria bacterium]